MKEGFNIGKPLYGYKAKKYRHPNPVKAARGHTKTRLEPDGIRAETVTQIALWTYHDGVGADTIADRLNADLVKYPPPEPPGKTRARGAWSKSSVNDHPQEPEVHRVPGVQPARVALPRREGQRPDQVGMVARTRPRTPDSKWMYDELTARRKAKRGSRDGNEPNTHPQTRRAYVFRSMIIHDCGRRMNGNHRHQSAYYMCHPKNGNRGRPDKYAGHVKAAYIREDLILEAVSAFFTDRVFGTDRRELLTADLATVDDRESRQRDADRERL